MTTPAMPLMPFSVPFEPQLGTYGLFIPAAFVNHNDAYNTQCIKLPPGMSQVRVTWDGAEGVRYRLVRAGEPLENTWTEVIAPGAVRSPRSSKIIEIALTEHGYFWLQASQTNSATTINAKARAGLTVVPMAGPEGRI